MDRQELTMRQVQVGANEVLKQISQLCEQLHLRYILTYGTMIGAVRHQGVIPWDDDIDIMMPRPDYETLKRYFAENARQLAPLKWFDPETVPEYPHMIARVSDQRYRLEFNNEKDYGIGLFVDIYPMDGVGSDMQKALRLVRRTKMLGSLCFLTGRKSFGRDNTRSKLKMAIKLPAYLWAKMMGKDHYVKKLSAAAASYDYDSSRYIACVCWPVGKVNGHETDVYEKSILDDRIEVPFEDSTMKIPREYDSFLTVNYGDYMTPPPEGQRTTNHTYRAYRL